ncbi:flagellar basal body rod C-terminal domain-containing protein [Methylobacterium sp. WL7]|uniref:FlgK family flagellar hook-associated protein n=1 Tax=Methylobacterium sp. WL7 TaxID=2603900 RepID=UPI0011CC35F3|nr:flagellar basal body rod C-terminal domain-containing protein [Methylobacterium sp. WL7]TXN39503.1 flagellar hook-associated protein FlgK [Methylobacterium sp. WL7]
MSLNALSNATAGLAATQAAINVVSQNVANAGTAGYVKRTLTPVATGTNNLGVANGTITRSFDAAALKQLRLETSGAAYTSTKASIASQLDALYGAPGSGAALDGTLNTFTESLQELSANPTSAAARTTVVSNASALASQINGAAASVQNLRSGVEAQLGTDTQSASSLLSSVASLTAGIELRDQILPQAQRQLDDLAGGLASSLTDSSRTAAMTSGVASIDLSGAIPATGNKPGAGLMAGNTLTISVTDLNNIPRNIILVASNASPPPDITADQTADGTAYVAAFSIKDGPGSYATVIKAVLDKLKTNNPTLPTLSVDKSTNSNFSAAALASGAALDIGNITTGTSILGAQANVTLPIATTDSATGYPQIALFTDLSTTPPPVARLYTGSLDDNSQRTGFAQRISINPNLVGNTAALTRSSTTDPTASGDRASKIYTALTSNQQTFSSSSGIGGVSAPYRASVVGFAQDVIASQGAASANANALNDTQQTALSTAQGRFAAGAGVNIDQEMSNLIALQTAYGANARILTAARDMLNQLLQI